MSTMDIDYETVDLYLGAPEKPDTVEHIGTRRNLTDAINSTAFNVERVERGWRNWNKEVVLHLLSTGGKVVGFGLRNYR